MKLIFSLDNKNIFYGIFKERKNRFLVICDLIDSNTNSIIKKDVEVHLSDSGRLNELLKEKRKVIVRYIESNLSRKTQYDLIAIEDEFKNFIFLNPKYHSQIANFLIEENILELEEPFIVYKEKKLGDSRIDFFVESKTKRYWIEVKGVTLREGNICLFPDSPTKRGEKHIEELVSIIEKEKNTYAYILFLSFVDCSCFRPNNKEGNFYKFLKEALKKEKFKIKVVKLFFNPYNLSLYYVGPIKICQDFIS